MHDLIAFLRERLDDDERYARIVLAVGQRLKDTPSAALMAIGRAGVDAMLDAPELVAEAARWKGPVPNDLERILREVAAKRAILELHQGAHECSGWNDLHREFDNCMWFNEWETCTTLRHLAAVWADHPDYRPEWKP